MPIDAKSVADLVKNKVVFGCASCKKMHQALNKGMAGCQIKECGSPLSGGTFEQYEGPMSPEFWPKVCWACGVPSVRAFHVIKSARTFGVCDEHNELHSAGFSKDEVLLLGSPPKNTQHNLIQALIDDEN